METIGKIRRRRLVQGESISSIARDLGLARNTVKRALKVEGEGYEYRRTRQPMPKLGPFKTLLDMVEASGRAGERRVFVLPIAVRQDGARVPSVERQCERFFQATPAAPRSTPERRIGLFRQVVEPTLQRELKHKGAAGGDGSYSADLIGYIEVEGRAG